MDVVHESATGGQTSHHLSATRGQDKCQLTAAGDETSRQLSATKQQDNCQLTAAGEETSCQLSATRGQDNCQLTAAGDETSRHPRPDNLSGDLSTVPPLPSPASPSDAPSLAIPYGDVYSISTSLSAYTFDSRCEFLRQPVGHEEEERTGTSEAKDCGILGCRPHCCRHWANIKFFIFVLCFLSTVSGTLVAGYVNSVITTIEKRFEIGSSYSGLIAASVEMGCLVAVIFVSYLGGRRHIPKWIGVGTLVQGTGALLFSLPHILAEQYTITGGLNVNTTKENICKSVQGGHSEPCVSKGSGNWGYVTVLVLAQILMGSGVTPLYTLGTTYIDDHVTKEEAPAYIAFIYATGALGPVLGFALGALMLQFYVDAFTFDYSELKLTTGDSRWVGMWWGGFIICGVLLLFVSIPFFAFPKVLLREKEKVSLAKQENLEDLLDEEQRERIQNYGKNIKDIPESMWHLLSNPTFVMTQMGICCEICIVSGFIVFLPKYLETQFSLSKSLANLLTGGIAIPGAVIGILIGGNLLKRFQLCAKGAIRITLTLNVMALCGFMMCLFLGCDNVKMAGATLPYFNSTGHQILEQANLTSACNLDCDCAMTELEPVCGSNGLTYFSPCHAGCTHLSHTFSHIRIHNYSNCACILGTMNQGAEVVMSPLATSGPCQLPCNSLLPFMILLFVMTFVVAGTQMPLVMVTLRSVSHEERAFALGMQFVILRLFAYIPAPIMFGNTIDSSCLVWKEKCGSQGSCLFYNIEHFRYKYIGVSAGLKLTGALFFAALLRRLSKADKDELHISGPVSGLVTEVIKPNPRPDSGHHSATEEEPDTCSSTSHHRGSHNTGPSDTERDAQEKLFTNVAYESAL